MSATLTITSPAGGTFTLTATTPEDRALLAHLLTTLKD